MVPAERDDEDEESADDETGIPESEGFAEEEKTLKAKVQQHRGHKVINILSLIFSSDYRFFIITLSISITLIIDFSKIHLVSIFIFFFFRNDARSHPNRRK